MLVALSTNFITHIKYSTRSLSVRDWSLQLHVYTCTAALPASLSFEISLSLYADRNSDPGHKIYWVDSGHKIYWVGRWGGVERASAILMPPLPSWSQLRVSACCNLWFTQTQRRHLRNFSSHHCQHSHQLDICSAPPIYRMCQPKVHSSCEPNMEVPVTESRLVPPPPPPLFFLFFLSSLFFTNTGLLFTHRLQTLPTKAEIIGNQGCDRSSR